jgi:hypothetical protein
MKDKNLIDEKIKTSIEYLRTFERNSIADDRLENNKQSIMNSINSNNHTLSKKPVLYIFKYLPAVAVILFVFFLSILLFFNNSSNENRIISDNIFDDGLSEELYVNLKDFVIDETRYSADNSNNFMNSIYEMMEEAVTNKEEIILTSSNDDVEDLLFGYWVFNSEDIEEEEDESYLNVIMNDYDSSFSFSIETN